MKAAGAQDTGGQRLDALINAVLRGSDEFGGGGRCGSAKIGYKVGDGEVRLVPDCGDDGNLGCGDGAGEELVIEAGEVFDRAAAAGEDNDIDQRGIFVK